MLRFFLAALLFPGALQAATPISDVLNQPRPVQGRYHETGENPAPRDAAAEARLDHLLYNNGATLLPEQFLASPQAYHWVMFYKAARDLFAAGRRDEAVMWLYAGQIRARLAAGLDPDSSRSNALYAALNPAIGKPIIAYARRNPGLHATQIDNALAWDAAHPQLPIAQRLFGDATVPLDPDNFAKVYALIRQGLRDYRAGLGE